MTRKSKGTMTGLGKRTTSRWTWLRISIRKRRITIRSRMMLARKLKKKLQQRK